MYCRKCGNIIADDAAFCSFCGTPTATEPLKPEAPAETLEVQEAEVQEIQPEIPAPAEPEAPAAREPETAADVKPIFDEFQWNVNDYPERGAASKTEDVDFDWNADPNEIRDRFADAAKPEPAVTEPEPVIAPEPEVVEPEQMSAAERIDKFYTFNKKNEEFQKLLNREYQKVKEGNTLGAELSEAEELASARFEARHENTSMDDFLEREGIVKPYEPKPFHTDVLDRIEAQEAAREMKLREEEARAKALEEARLEAEARMKAEEEERQRAAEEARIRAEEEARIRAEEAAKENERLKEEARIRAEETAKFMAEEEARKKAEEEARIQAEAEARRRAEEEARIRAEEEARAKAAEEARLKAEEEARAKAEAEARMKAEAEARAAKQAEKIKAQREARRAVEAEERARAEQERRAAEEARIRAKLREERESISRQAESAAVAQEAQKVLEQTARMREAEAAKIRAAIAGIKGEVNATAERAGLKPAFEIEKQAPAPVIPEAPEVPAVPETPVVPETPAVPEVKAEPEIEKVEFPEGGLPRKDDRLTIEDIFGKQEKPRINVYDTLEPNTDTIQPKKKSDTLEPKREDILKPSREDILKPKTEVKDIKETLVVPKARHFDFEAPAAAETAEAAATQIMPPRDGSVIEEAHKATRDRISNMAKAREDYFAGLEAKEDEPEPLENKPVTGRDTLLNGDNDLTKTRAIDKAAVLAGLDDTMRISKADLKAADDKGLLGSLDDTGLEPDTDSILKPLERKEEAENVEDLLNQFVIANEVPEEAKAEEPVMEAPAFEAPVLEKETEDALAALLASVEDDTATLGEELPAEDGGFAETAEDASAEVAEEIAEEQAEVEDDLDALLAEADDLEIPEEGFAVKEEPTVEPDAVASMAIKHGLDDTMVMPGKEIQDEFANSFDSYGEEEAAQLRAAQEAEAQADAVAEEISETPAAVEAADVNRAVQEAPVRESFEDETEKKGGAGRLILKIILVILIVIFALELAGIGIKFLAPQSGAADVIDNQLNKIIHVITGDEEINSDNVIS